MVWLFEPLLHWYVKPVPEFALKLTLDPEQNVVAPPAVIVAVGIGLNVTVVAGLVAIHPLLVVTVSV